MSLNIKSKETHHLAQQLAALTGQSITDAVTDAVRERLTQVRRERDPHLLERLLEIGKIVRHI